jgi:hypothetical protein
MSEIRALDRPNAPESTTLVVEAILKEISLAERWTTIEVGYDALTKVRNIADKINREMSTLKHPQSSG